MLIVSVIDFGCHNGLNRGTEIVVVNGKFSAKFASTNNHCKLTTYTCFLFLKNCWWCLLLIFMVKMAWIHLHWLSLYTNKYFFTLVLIIFVFDFGVQNSLDGGATIVVVNVNLCYTSTNKQQEEIWLLTPILLYAKWGVLWLICQVWFFSILVADCNSCLFFCSATRIEVTRMSCNLTAYIFTLLCKPGGIWFGCWLFFLLSCFDVIAQMIALH